MDEIKGKINFNIKYKKCIVNGCYNNVHCGGKYCGKHYHQLERYGHVIDRTQKDLNNIIIKDKIAYIELYDKHYNVKNKAIIDSKDVEKVKYYKWNLSSSGYVYCRNNNIFLHNLLLDLDIKDIDNNDINIDHINHNRLDNRKENLRYVTRSFNNANRNQKCYYIVDGKYVVTTKIDGILHTIGKYNTKEEAISAREEWFKNNNTIYNQYETQSRT